MKKLYKKYALANLVTALLVLVLSVTIMVAPILGYGLNVVKLIDCDFKPSYKAEAIRTVGVFIPFVGMVAGYMDIEDGVTK